MGDFYQKQQFQNMLFPEGLVYDAQNNDYRTPTVNPVISYIADLSKNLEHKKAGILEKLTKIPASYPEPESNRHGFPQVFETSASTNSAIRAFKVVGKRGRKIEIYSISTPLVFIFFKPTSRKH